MDNGLRIKMLSVKALTADIVNETAGADLKSWNAGDVLEMAAWAGVVQGAAEAVTGLAVFDLARRAGIDVDAIRKGAEEMRRAQEDEK